jgi:hypothetical protein
MFIVFEISNPFQPFPKFRKDGLQYRAMWLWFGIAYVNWPYAEFIDAIIDCAKEDGNQ